MTTTKTFDKKSDARHNQSYKDEALKLVAIIGVSKTTKQLNLHESQLYTWYKAANTLKR